MDAYEIQTVVLECLREAQVPRVLRTTIYSLSGEPGEPDVPARFKRNTVLVVFIATYGEFMTFRNCAGSRGVWVNASWKKFGKTDRFVYEVAAVEKWK
jgi:hypothetical protein